MRKVYFQGAFDLFHWAHLESFKRAKAHGDYLIVGINSDALIESYKGKKAVYPYDCRADMVAAVSIVDEIWQVDDRKSLVTLEKIRPDVYVICNEWEKEKDDERAFMKSIGGEVVVLPYIEAQFIVDIKAKIKKNVEEKTLNLCEKCHQKI